MRLAGVQGEEGPGNRGPQKVDLSPSHSELSRPGSCFGSITAVFAGLSRPGSEQSAWRGYSRSLGRPSNARLTGEKLMAQRGRTTYHGPTAGKWHRGV